MFKIWILLCLLFFFSIGAASFSGQKAFCHAKKIVDFGPRPSGSKALRSVNGYIVSSLKKDGLIVRQQSFTASTPMGKVPMKNITALKKGGGKGKVILAAHYESKYFKNMYFVGANDNASGTAVLLALAACLGKYSFDVELVFFDGEEAFAHWSSSDSLYGSRYYVKNSNLSDVKAMILLDMVGDRDLAIDYDLYSSGFLRKILTRAAMQTNRKSALSGRQLYIEDDHIPFLNAAIPSIDIIDFSYDDWHMTTDTMDKLSAESLETTGLIVLKMLELLNEDIKKREIKK